MTRLLLLIPTTSYRATDFLEAATALGVEVTVGSNQRHVLDAIATGASGGGTVRIDFRDTETGVADIVAFAAERPLAAIVGVDDETTLLAAEASATLGLPHNPAEAVAIAGNKYRMRTRLANSGLPTPGFRIVAVGDDPENAAREAPYPCVLKPLALAASRGVIRADDRAGFVAAFRRIGAILGQPDVVPMGESARHILVESYIPGREVALEGMMKAGRLTVLALFDKPDPMEGPFFEETIYVTPSRLAPETRRAVTETAGRAIAALGLTEGPVHAEMRINDRGVWVLEVAARSIGGLCSRVLRFGAGVSLEELILRHALGMEATGQEREGDAAGVMMIPTPRAGMLRRVDGLDAARAAPLIEDVTIAIPRGHALVPLPEGNRYLGFIFARGETPQEVEAALRASHRRLDFVIDG